MSDKTQTIKPRIRNSIIQSLQAGVTPKIGLNYIQVGRSKEIEAITQDIENIVDGGAMFRLIIGDFGSGKSFFLHLMKLIALEKDLVVIDADLSPDRRIYATGGQAKNLYRELMKNMTIKTKPEGNALTSLVEKFISQSREKADRNNTSVTDEISTALRELHDLFGGYDFASVINSYWKGFDEGDNELKDNAIRWLRGEFSAKTDAKKALGVRSAVSDSDVYDYLKILSRFVIKAGYKGLLVNLDEMVNLYKLANKQARDSNYEQLLRILNDCLQGSASNIGFLLGGTPEFLTDTRRGLYNYEALKTRLEENRFSQQTGQVDYNSPVLNLASLTKEELYVLLENLRIVFAAGDEENLLVPDEALGAFLQHCSERIGADYFRTPRNTIKEFVSLLSQIEQYPDTRWQDLIGDIDIQKEVDTDMDIPEIVDPPTSAEEPDELKEIKI